MLLQLMLARLDLCPLVDPVRVNTAISGMPPERENAAARSRGLGIDWIRIAALARTNITAGSSEVPIVDTHRLSSVGDCWWL